jgi:hypothetical protein
MAELTQPELKAICRVLAHFLDGGWTEILESLQEEESETARRGISLRETLPAVSPESRLTIRTTKRAVPRVSPHRAK